MPVSLSPRGCPVVPAGEYLKRFPDRGRPVRLPEPGLALYGVSDCLCLGLDSQAVGPVHGGELPFLFEESCPYIANEHELAGIAASALGPNRGTPGVTTLNDARMLNAVAMSDDVNMIDIDEAVPLFPPGADNLWHFVTESLPKLLALEGIGYSGPYIVPAYTRTQRGAVIAQSLAMFGIPEERLLYSGPAYRVRRLMLPQRLSGFSLADNMPLTALLRDRLIEAAGTLPGSKRLYIQRIGRRKPRNEDEVLALLGEFGFSVMIPEEHSLAEQWRMLTNVECSVMVHGANTTLTLVQPPRSAFVELFSHQLINYSNMHAVRLSKFRYHPLIEELEPSTYPGVRTPLEDFLREGRNDDPCIDILHLRILLESLG